MESGIAMQIYVATHIPVLRISWKLMKHFRRELIENLLFNKEADRNGVPEQLPAKMAQYASSKLHQARCIRAYDFVVKTRE